MARSHCLSVLSPSHSSAMLLGLALYILLCYCGCVLQEEIDEAGDEGVPEQPPTLQLFKKQVDSYESIYAQVEKFEVRISMRSLRACTTFLF